MVAPGDHHIENEWRSRTRKEHLGKRIFCTVCGSWLTRKPRDKNSRQPQRRILIQSSFRSPWIWLWIRSCSWVAQDEFTPELSSTPAAHLPAPASACKLMCISSMRSISVMYWVGACFPNSLILFSGIWKAHKWSVHSASFSSSALQLCFFLKWLHWRAKSFTSLIFSAGHFTRSDGKAGSSPEHLRYPICFATFDLQNKTNSCHTPFTLSPNLKARDYWFYLQGHWELWSCKLIWVWLTVSTKKTVRWEISCFLQMGHWALWLVLVEGQREASADSGWRVAKILHLLWPLTMCRSCNPLLPTSYGLGDGLALIGGQRRRRR